MLAVFSRTFLYPLKRGFLVISTVCSLLLSIDNICVMVRKLGLSKDLMTGMSIELQYLEGR